MEKCGQGESETSSPGRTRVSPGARFGEPAGRETVEDIGVTGAGRENSGRRTAVNYTGPNFRINRNWLLR